MQDTMRTDTDSASKVGFSLRVAVLLAAVLVLGATDTSATTRQQKPQPTIKAGDLARQVHARVNEQRKKHRLQPLAWSDALSRIAVMHSRDMADRDYLDHNTPEGKTFSDRYRQSGFSCEILVGNKIHAGAENLALSRLYNATTRENGITYYHWNSPEEIALRTVDGWMDSPSHRENILTPHWRQEGVGIEIGPGNKIYITENFC